MSIVCINVFDIPSQAQYITFSNPSEVQNISYINGSITLTEHASFDLTIQDFLLYVKFLNTYFALLTSNFPNVNVALPLPAPQSEYDFKIESDRITYIQNSMGFEVFNFEFIFRNLYITCLKLTPTTVISIQEFQNFIIFINRMNKEVLGV